MPLPSAIDDVVVVVVFFETISNNFSIIVYVLIRILLESAMNSTLITFINCTFSKIIMTVFILIKHYTSSMRHELASLTLWH